MTDCVSYCKIECKWTWFFKSNRSEMFYKIGVIKNFSILTLKHLRPVTPFPVNLVKFLRTPFLQNTIWRLLLDLFISFTVFLFFFFTQRTNRNRVSFCFLICFNMAFERDNYKSFVFGKLNNLTLQNKTSRGIERCF